MSIFPEWSLGVLLRPEMWLSTGFFQLEMLRVHQKLIFLLRFFPDFGLSFSVNNKAVAAPQSCEEQNYMRLSEEKDREK